MTQSGSMIPDSETRAYADRPSVRWDVECASENTFLYASIANHSWLGVFVYTTEPLEVGTSLVLRFLPGPTSEPFFLAGCVQWINPVRALASNRNPGMGIELVGISPDDRERLVEAVHTIAYIRDSAN